MIYCIFSSKNTLTAVGMSLDEAWANALKILTETSVSSMKAQGFRCDVKFLEHEKL